MDVVGRLFLKDGSEVKIVTGIDDHSRFCVCARIVARATARLVATSARTGSGCHGRGPQAEPAMSARRHPQLWQVRERVRAARTSPLHVGSEDAPTRGSPTR
jgi:hypothetical protein